MTVANFSATLRLTRLDRIYTNELFYLLTFCTHNRQPLLANPIVH